MNHNKIANRRMTRIKRNTGKRKAIHKLRYAMCVVCMLGLLSGCGNENRTDLIITTESVLPEETTESQMTEEITEEKADTGYTTEQVTTEAATEDTGSDSAISAPAENSTAKGVDYDLTTMSKSMIYATVNQLMIDPDSYLGKTFRITGEYYAAYYEPTGRYYHYCVIQDATACCAQGLEFMLGDGSDEDAYPAENTSIVVQGTFETYTEDDNPQMRYCHLVNATIEAE